jgi:hypothetical protein
MRAVTSRNKSRGHLWRSRWAAIGAAVAVTFGAGGLVAVNAAGGVDSTTVLTDPVRVLDSRDPVNVGLPGPFESQSPQKLKVTGSIPTTTGTKTVVPAGATGVLLNVTAVAPQADGFISIRPGDATGLPTTSSLNVTVGEVLANAVLVALPTSGPNAGQIDITWDAYGFLEPRTDMLIDVVGYTSNSTLAALQAEIDAKANSADVQQSILNNKVWSGAVGSTGSKDSTGPYTSSKTGTGQYRVSFVVTGLNIPFSGQGVWTITPLCAAFSDAITQRTIVSGSGIVAKIEATVQMSNAAGASADCGFQLHLTLPDPDDISSSLSVDAQTLSGDPYDIAAGSGCTTEGTITTCID